MNKRYLFFVSLSYSYTILRPLQAEIWRRGDEVAWFIEEPCADQLADGERRLRTIRDVMDYNPVAIFAPGNWIYDFFPGIKVKVFHGYAINKRNGKNDTHFIIRDWFDIYCTQGPSSTPHFKELEKKYGYFRIYETGWCKVDTFFEKMEIPARQRPVILFASTFSRRLTSAPYLLETITQLIETKPWDWIITLHPKLDNPELIQKYRQLAETHQNVTFYSSIDGPNTLKQIDVMLCDSSSIIVEVMLLDKPVVTFRNTHPGNFLIDVSDKNEIGPAIEKALTRPDDLMENIRAYTAHHEAHRDGRNCARVLDAVDDFILNYSGKTRKKPLDLLRKIKLRLKIKEYGLLFRL